VIVGTGEDQETFFVHEDMICAESTFFKAACSGNWLENKEKTIRLPEHEVDIFCLYLESIYREDIDWNHIFDFPTTEIRGYQFVEDEHNGQFQRAVLDLCKLWSLADYLGDRFTSDQLVATIAGVFSPKSMAQLAWPVIEHIAENAPVDSKLHVWMIDLLVEMVVPSQAESLMERLPTASVTQLLKRLIVDKASTIGL
jgi:hypothetical protein